jgi:hydrogenase maturation protease
MTEAEVGGTIVIGLGNPLMTDDGVGLAALHLLETAWSFDPEVQFLDGGTWGMNLLHPIESAQRVVLLDAIDQGAAPGAVVVLERDALPRFFGLKVSPHQVDLKEVLAVAELRGTLPERIVAIGLQPARIALGTALSDGLEHQLPALVDEVVARLEAWGHRSARAVPVSP